MTRANQIGALALVISAAGGTLAAHRAPEGLPYYRSAELTPEWLTGEGARKATHRIGAFRFTDQHGETVTNAEVSGRIYVASFFFTTCRGICPNLYTNLSKVVAAYRGDSAVMLLSHSVTPESDSVATLATYAREHHIEGNQWRLLTGDHEAVRQIARRSYFVELGDTTGYAPGTMFHSETIVLVDRVGHIRGLYDGSLAFDTARLIDDIAVLKKER